MHLILMCGTSFQKATSTSSELSNDVLCGCCIRKYGGSVVP